jgi:glycosyltransferase involved in cell wall biosynthesis
MKPRHLLLVAFYFPPLNQVASYRPGCFAKYLPENGWLPTVIAGDFSGRQFGKDPDFVGKIPPEVSVVRLPCVGPDRPLAKFVFRKLWPYVYPHRAPYVWWRAARRAVKEIGGKTAFSAAWVTSDPIVALDLGAYAGAQLRVPWMADLRDSFNVQPMGSSYKRPLWARQERRLCRAADAVVTVSGSLAKDLSAITGREVLTLENGFDPELFPPSPGPRRDVFRLCYTGTFRSHLQSPRPVLEAVAGLIGSGAIPKERLEVAFYEPTAEQVERAWPGALTTLPVRVFPRVSHREVIEIQQRSAALLLLTVAGQKGVLTGKLFDYLGAGRPVLAVPDDQGDVAELLTRTGAGVSASAPEAIARILKQWYDQWAAGGDISLRRREEQVQAYSRRAQARRLAEWLDEMTKRKGCACRTAEF